MQNIVVIIIIKIHFVSHYKELKIYWKKYFSPSMELWEYYNMKW